MATRIREARQARGWSQQDLAERIGVSQPTIVHWEQGTHTPRNLALARLADTLGVSRQWLQESPSVNPEQARDSAPAYRKSANPTLSYLTAPIHHVPIFAGPLDSEEIDACLKAHRVAIDYVPTAIAVQMPLGLLIEDIAVAKSFPAGTIAIIECADRTLVDGKTYLINLNGIAKLRRFGAFPARLEADRAEDTVSIQSQPIVLGRLIAAIRHY
jgi:transcriptional regulator with XRE-family HTH domain